MYRVIKPIDGFFKLGIVSVALGLAACSSDRFSGGEGSSFGYNADTETAAAADIPPVETVPVTSAPLPGSAPVVQETSAVAQPVAPQETSVSADWKSKYPSDNGYFNRGSAPIPVYAAPSTAVEPVANLAVGDGGSVKECTPDARLCRIEYGNQGASGWVEISRLTGQAL